MESCPGCGKMVSVNALEDADGRSWHADCLKHHEALGNVKRMKADDQQAMAERLEQQRDALRAMVEDVKRSR